MENRIVIIDGNSLINRAYYAMQRPMITRQGVYTQGIFGFLNMLYKIIEDYGPGYMAVAWDRKAPTFRHKEYDAYKAGRKKMPPELAMEMPLMKDILDAMHISSLEIDGFEADDIIGTVARTAEEQGLEPLIITGDKDALQLATDKTKILITRKGISEFDLYDADKMKERYELTPRQFIELKGLMGDSSDNLPGIPGVGEKTGIKLLKQFGSVANLLANTDQISVPKLRQKVEDNGQLAIMSRRLAEINTHVPLDIDLEEFRMEEPDYDRLISLYTDLELNTFLRRIHPAATAENTTEPDDEEGKYRIHDLSASDGDILAELPQDGNAVIKVFGNSDHVNKPKIFAVALLQGDDYYYIAWEDEHPEELLDRLSSLEYIGSDLVMDYYMLRCLGAEKTRTAFDTAVAEYALEPSKSAYDIRTLAAAYLHWEIPSEKDVEKKIRELGDDGSAKHAVLREYGLKWCRAVQHVSEEQKKELERNDLMDLCVSIEFPLIEVLAAMEADGVSVSEEKLEELGNGLTEEIGRIENEIYERAGEQFKINSPQQLGHILFEKMGLPAGKKTKRGYSTSADVLEKIQEEDPIVPLVLQYRTLTKLNSTYIVGLRPLIGPDGKIHAHFQQTVAATGRLSCTEPNLQNIPIRYELGRKIRQAFVAGEDHVLIGADYSQIELRIMAHLSGDENLISAFNNGDDIHRMTAARVFNLDYDSVTPAERSRAKAVNFGVIYGISGFGLSSNLHISRKKADEYIKEYFAKHPAVKSYLDGQIDLCRKQGYSTTMFGRKRYIREISSSNFMTRQLGERLAMNSPIQGTAADIIKIAMNHVFRELEERHMESRLILQIHDELIICAPLSEEEQVKELLVRNMESAADMKVQLLCDMNAADNWYDLK